jgi:hypothetical protein
MTMDGAGLDRRLRPLQAGLTDNYGLIWTAGILLRIRCSPKVIMCPKVAGSRGKS